MPSAINTQREVHNNTDIIVDNDGQRIDQQVDIPENEKDRSESDEEENKSNNLFMDSLYSAHPSDFTKQFQMTGLATAKN